jgi:hypothetical protein
VTRVRIGSGAGFSADRIDPAVALLRDGDLDDLVLECLAERTIALGQRRRRLDPEAGYDPLLRRRLDALLPDARRRGVRLLTNMGSANPTAAGQVARAVAEAHGLTARIGVVTGDDVLDQLDLDAPALEDGVALRAHGPVVSANAYLGADAIRPALTSGCDLVITGRVADPSLFLAPLAERLGWRDDDWDRSAAGTMVGHLLECAGQLTGGYFADPGKKDVPDLAHLGFPYADVDPDGAASFGKLHGTGGRIDRATVREQLLYEITDPTAYATPDVYLDLRGVRVEQSGLDRVAVRGASGRPRPDQLKVSVGYRAGYRAEGEISYVGPNAAQRARLAGDVVSERLKGHGLRRRVDLIGTLPAPVASGGPAVDVDPGESEIRLRVAALCPHQEIADEVCGEVEALYTNGPAGGGGVRTETTEVIGIVSTVIPRERVRPRLEIIEVGGDHAPA